MLAYRAPAYVGAGGLGGALVSALFNSVAAPSAGFAPVCEAPVSAPYPPDLAAWLLDPPSGPLLLGACLGAFLLIFSFLLGLICGGVCGALGVLLWCRAVRPTSGHHGWTRVAGYLRTGSAPP